MKKVVCGSLLLAALSAFGQTPIKIGEINSYSAIPQFTQPYKQGWQLAVEQINAQGGLLGRKVEVIARDDKVDAFYDSIFRNLVSHMMENPSSISSAAQLLFVARNIERIGDHATNVAELVHYAATGQYLPERVKDEGGA